ncbi:MAG: recombinase family protein [Solibacillus sp.]
MAVGIYIRVSTNEQVLEGYSISAQRERLTAFCVAQGWDDYKFYVDEGISGKDTKRPEFQKLLNDIENGFIKTILVYRLDRMTRSVRDLHNILDFLDKNGCVFRSATEIYDTSTAMGRMFITIVAAIAEWESSNLGERVVMGQVEKARQGEWAAQAPYGWRKDKEHKLHINEAEIGAVKLMVQKMHEGLSFRQLSEYMSSTDYKPKRGYKWHIRTLMDLMHNPVLYGAMRWKDEIYEGTHEGILTKEQFNELQRIINSRQNYKKRDVKTHYIYQMKLTCPDCGNRLSSERYVWKNKDGNQQVRNSYRCQKCALDNKERPAFNVREVKIDEALMEFFENYTLSPPQVDLSDETSTEINDIQNEIKRIERERGRYQQAWAKELISDNEFEEQMKSTRLRKEDLEKKLIELDVTASPEFDKEKVMELTKSFNDNFQLLNQKERREFVQSFIESINIEIIKRTSKKSYRDQVIKIADVSFY